MVPRLFAARWLLTTVVALAPLYFPAPVEANGQKQVLVLYSTRRDSQIAIVAERELPRILAGGLQQELDYYSEYIDRARFQDAGYKSAFRDFLRLKYKGVAFDVVIAMQDIALEFVGENRNEVFPGTPVVFFAGSSSVRRLPNSTGVVAPLNFGGTVALAGQLQPDLRRVFVVTGTELDDRTYENLVRSQLRSFEPRFEITYLSGLPTPDLERRLATLPEHSCIYYLLVNQDGAGAKFHPLEYLDHLAMVANHRSIPGWTRRWIMASSAAASRTRRPRSRRVGLLALRVLRGERGRQYSDVVTQFERQSGGLAAVATVGHQRIARPCRHDRQVHGTFRLGPLQAVYHRRRGHPAGADTAHRGAARSACETTTGRGASAWR